MHSPLSGEERGGGQLFSNVHAVMPRAGVNIHAGPGWHAEGPHILRLDVVSERGQSETNNERRWSKRPKKLTTVYCVIKRNI